jgi:hypothetical protein
MGHRGRSREVMQKLADDAAWARFRTEPWRAESHRRPPGTGRPVVRLVHLPSFSTASFFEINHTGDDYRLYTAAVVEDAPGDLRLLGYDALDLPSERLRAFHLDLLALKVPIDPGTGNVAGTDGEVTRLSLFGGFLSEVSFQWWSSPPKPWRRLAERTKAFLREIGVETESN